MEYPSHARNIDEASNIIHYNIRDYKLSPPPVLIAHSMSSFLVQKYLESHAASGLILVNPLSINCSRSIVNLHDRWSNRMTDILRQNSTGNCNDDHIVGIDDGDEDDDECVVDNNDDGDSRNDDIDNDFDDAVVDVDDDDDDDDDDEEEEEEEEE